jgi:1-deoxy-D-xylulose-5-phosphate reductoisomerase
MKKKIAVLGSTGSIGGTLLKLINNNEFDVQLLSANKNFKKILKQAKKFKVKNIIITDHKSYLQAVKFNKNKNLKIHNKFNLLDKILKKKLDYVMASISGIEGLKPTFKIIKYTKKIAIANKESLICAWPLIKNELKKFNTKFIPIDSEHFTIWSEINNVDTSQIKKIYLTASGGPLLNYDLKKFNKINVSNILKHPTWVMGKKISVDSATMMNKCFEVIEAKNIFNLSYKQIDILIHPKSYIHSIIIYKNGLSKIILHDTTMRIPIFNSLYNNNKSYKNNKNLDLKKLNNLNLTKIDIKKFPIVKLLKKLPVNFSLFETIIVTINDFMVSKFLNNKIHFNDISNLVLYYLQLKEFNKYKKLRPKNIAEIIKTSDIIKNYLFNLKKI